MRFLGVWFGVVVVSVACAAGEAPAAQEAQGCSGTRSDLFAYVGTYQWAGVLGDADLGASLDQLLGPDRSLLETNLAVAGSMDMVACHLVIAGNAERQGGTETAILAVNLVNGSIAAGIQSGGRIRVFSGGGDYLGVPVVIRDWAVVAAGGFESRFTPPAGTELVAPVP